jgi:hypothetical protein
VTTTATPPAPAKRKRGRETTLDMLRSLGLVLVPVVALWFLAQPGSDAEQRIREVDQSGHVSAWQDATPTAPVPDAPKEWTPTVSAFDGSTLRLGWNTDDDRYAEYAATTAGGDRFLDDVVGAAEEQGTVEAGGVEWRRFVEDDGSVSLVREVDGVTVVVGTLRASVPQEQVATLAATVRPRG